jgi:hypothetical protein
MTLDFDVERSIVAGIQVIITLHLVVRVSAG